MNQVAAHFSRPGSDITPLPAAHERCPPDQPIELADLVRPLDDRAAPVICRVRFAGLVDLTPTSILILVVLGTIHEGVARRLRPPPWGWSWRAPPRPVAPKLVRQASSWSLSADPETERRVPTRPTVGAILTDLSPTFAQLYSRVGRPLIAPKKLLRALLLQILYTKRSPHLISGACDPSRSSADGAGATGSCGRAPPDPSASSALWPSPGRPLGRRHHRAALGLAGRRVVIVEEHRRPRDAACAIRHSRPACRGTRAPARGRPCGDEWGAP